MTPSDQPDRHDRSPVRRTTGAWVAVAVLLGIGIVVPLLVPVFARETPALFDFPFYYWFQFLLIPVVSALTFAAYRISTAAGRRDRSRFGLPPEDSADERTRS